jgi:flavin prenyltransferase
MRIIVGISGASGVSYGIEFLKHCKNLNIETHLIMSKWGKNNIQIESTWQIDQISQMASCCYQNNNLAAAPSSGSFRHDGMIIIPCSMKTLSAVANGYSETLISRAADVTLKEGRKLVLVPRETPLNAIHLENMLKLARLGVVIAPPVPAMYGVFNDLQAIIDHTIGRLLDQFSIENDLVQRWKGLLEKDIDCFSGGNKINDGR